MWAAVFSPRSTARPTRLVAELMAHFRRRRFDADGFAAFEGAGAGVEFGGALHGDVERQWTSLSVVMMSPTRRPIRSPVVILRFGQRDDHLDLRPVEPLAEGRPRFGGGAATCRR